MASYTWLAAGLILMSSAAAAQTPGTPGQTTVAPLPARRPNAEPRPRKDTAAPVPSARVLGVPVTADAPVSPPYDGTAYKTLGGQAETGEDAISGQVMQPTDSARPRR